MPAQLLDGKLMAAELEEELKKRVEALAQKGYTPGLTVILVGDDPASQTYVSNKEKACARLGIRSRTLRMPADTTQETLEAAIREAKGFVLDESNKLKRLPKGYAPGSPYDEWLKLKDVYITERLAPEFMLDKELLKNTLHEFRKTKHFSDILNRAVQFAYDEMI